MHSQARCALIDGWILTRIHALRYTPWQCLMSAVAVCMRARALSSINLGRLASHKSCLIQSWRVQPVSMPPEFSCPWKISCELFFFFLFLQKRWGDFAAYWFLRLSLQCTSLLTYDRVCIQKSFCRVSLTDQLVNSAFIRFAKRGSPKANCS